MVEHVTEAKEKPTDATVGAAYVAGEQEKEAVEEKPQVPAAPEDVQQEVVKYPKYAVIGTPVVGGCC